jgi:hypothetical protein
MAPGVEAGGVQVAEAGGHSGPACAAGATSAAARRGLNDRPEGGPPWGWTGGKVMGLRGITLRAGRGFF